MAIRHIFMSIWYSLWSFRVFLFSLLLVILIWNFCTKKNLATLLRSMCAMNVKLQLAEPS
jgi:hypothetical protein